ncbi:MAG: hypothetical protein RIT24_953 [Planctomycetota bacterium]|jgi:hypothetical protein
MSETMRILAETERRLKDYAAEAIRTQAVPDAIEALDAANAVADWVASRRDGRAGVAASARLPQIPALERSALAMQVADFAAAGEGSGVTKPSRDKNRGYPKFLRTGSELIKIGWSKKEGQEYVHRVRREYLMATVTRIAQVASTRSPFVMDDLAPVQAGGKELPSYLVYVTMKWLCHEGLVEHVGRAGYEVRTSTLTVDAERAWQGLNMTRR